MRPLIRPADGPLRRAVSVPPKIKPLLRYDRWSSVASPRGPRPVPHPRKAPRLQARPRREPSAGPGGAVRAAEITMTASRRDPAGRHRGHPKVSRHGRNRSGPHEPAGDPGRGRAGLVVSAVVKGAMRAQEPARGSELGLGWLSVL
ncbi:hypothetical protein Areg01_71110 [Actinoplanes regularis]|nr:hypothetical protein Areg01_71110 [Actinoplanes regularis]